MNKRLISTLLVVTALEGLIAILFVFGIPSEIENAWLWGFSKSRMAVGGGILITVLLLLAITLFVFLNDKRTSVILQKIKRFLEKDNHLLVALLILLDILFFDLLFILAACTSGECVAVRPQSTSSGCVGCIDHSASHRIFFVSLSGNHQTTKFLG